VLAVARRTLTPRLFRGESNNDLWAFAGREQLKKSAWGQTGGESPSVKAVLSVSGIDTQNCQQYVIQVDLRQANRGN